MNIRSIIAAALAACLLAGCQSSSKSWQEKQTTMPASQQKGYLDRAKPPQEFGLGVVREGNGIGFIGTCRLHPNQVASAKLLKDDIPVIKMQGRARRQTFTALVDTSEAVSWIEFSKSQELNAHFLGVNDKVIPYRGINNTGGANAFAAVVTQMRIDQLIIENVPLYVRMAIGTLGPIARGIEKPDIDAVIGYDMLRTFEFVQFDLAGKRIVFSASRPYEPNDYQLATAARIVQVPGEGLAVQGDIYGTEVPIVLDFAGDYHFASYTAENGVSKQVSLGDVVYCQVPTLALPGQGRAARAGRKMLEDYLVTVCPRTGVVYFERPAGK